MVDSLLVLNRPIGKRENAYAALRLATPKLYRTVKKENSDIKSHEIDDINYSFDVKKTAAKQ